MRSKRPIVINNCLVHGICNFNCITCTVNKPYYKGPREYQNPDLFKTILKRIEEAAKENIRISYLALSGDGEPTLHPEFKQIIELASEFQRGWNIRNIPVPEIAVVTNGRALKEKNILTILAGKQIGLKISFPTIDVQHYNEIMLMDPNNNGNIQEGVLENIALACEFYANQQIPKLEIHISPPYAPYVNDDIDKTIDHLIAITNTKKAHQLNLVLFPTLTNRGGELKIYDRKMNTYKRIYKKYNKKKFDEVFVNLTLSWKYFYRNIFDLIDLLRAFEYPCIWDGNFFLTAGGDSCCCNDQSVFEKEGNISENTLKQLLEIKEKRSQSEMCKKCNQAPEQMSGGIYLAIHRLCTKIKMAKNSFDLCRSDKR